MESRDRTSSRPNGKGCGAITRLLPVARRYIGSLTEVDLAFYDALVNSSGTRGLEVADNVCWQ